MNGEELYKIYEETEIIINNCEIESWDETRDSIKDVWNSMAETLHNLAPDEL